MKYLDPYRPELGTATLAQKLKRVVRNRTPIVQTFGAMILWRGLVLAEAPLPGWTVESGYEVMLNSHSWLRRLLNYGVSVFVILGLVGLWRYGERYLEFLDSSRRYLGPVITAYGDGWKKIFTAPSTATTIYQRTRALPPELR
jgi:hypothetical protein